MSDARAKAEARRAKILARERSQMGVTAIGDAAMVLPVEGKKVERPLAARRNRVKSLASEAAEGDAVEGDAAGESGAADASLDDAADVMNDDDIIDKEMPALEGDEAFQSTPSQKLSGTAAAGSAKQGSGSNGSSGSSVDKQQLKEQDQQQHAVAAATATATATAEAPSSSSAKTELARKKSIQEVEREIAENTARFDSSETNKTKKEKEKEKKAAEKSVAKKKEFLAKRNRIGAVQPHSVQRMARFLLIVAIGVYQGYYVFLRNRSQPSMGLVGGEISDSVLTASARGGGRAGAVAGAAGGSGKVEVLVDEFGDATVFADRISGDGAQRRAAAQAASDGADGAGNAEGGERTWGGWAYGKGKAYFEATITAVSFTYYVGNILAAPITTRMAQRQQGAGAGNLEKIMEFFQNFVDGIVEYVFCMLGEWSTHVAVLVATVVVLTLHAELYDVAAAVAEDAAAAATAAAGIAEEL